MILQHMQDSFAFGAASCTAVRAVEHGLLEGASHLFAEAFAVHFLGPVLCISVGLDGGAPAWIGAGLDVESGALTAPQASPVESLTLDMDSGRDAVADAQYILGRLGDNDFALLDARTKAEVEGADRRAERGGRIPGARNYDWLRAFVDPTDDRRLRDRDEILGELAGLGITPDKEVVVYCQTHHRSSQSYCMLRDLGFERVRGYPGAWSEWGNQDELPIEVG